VDKNKHNRNKNTIPEPNPNQKFLSKTQSGIFIETKAASNSIIF
jgi:hypothetical protein